MLAPAASRVVSRPSRAITSRIRLLPGKTTKVQEGAIRRPSSTRVTACMSSQEELVHDPTMTCSTGSPSTSETGTTRSGEPGQGDQRLERVQVELDAVVVLGVGIRSERPPLRLAPEQAEVLAGGLVGREHAGGEGQLGAHVADGGPLRQGQRRRAGPAVLEDPPAAAAHRVAPQQLHDHVLGRDPRPQPAGEPHRGDARHGQVIGPAAHGHRHVEAARADGEHAGGAAERGVAVGAEDELARDAERLEVDLVADAVAGLGEPRAVAPRRGLEIAVVVGVARVDLVDVVIDVGDHARRPHPREPHGLELEERHGAVGVGEQRLVHPQPDLVSRDRLPGDQVRVDELAGEAPAHAA